MILVSRKRKESEYPGYISRMGFANTETNGWRVYGGKKRGNVTWYTTMYAYKKDSIVIAQSDGNIWATSWKAYFDFKSSYVDGITEYVLAS